MNTKRSTNYKFKRMFANILSIVVILAMAFPATGTVAAQESTPFLVAFPEWESVEGYSYPLGVNVRLEIDDPSTADITLDYFDDGIVVETGWGGNYVKFNFWGEDGYDLKTDDLVSLIYNGERLTHRVRNLSVTNVDVDTDSLIGMADPGEDVFANTYDDWGVVVTTTTLSSGEWIVNAGLNLEYNSGGRAQIYDSLGNSTAVDWSTPPPPPSPMAYVVNTTDDNDDGTCDESHCSLREAINASNVNPAADTIAFKISGDPPFIIQPGSPLPNIDDPVTIDGTSQPEFEGQPIIELDGTNAGGGTSGLFITAGNSTVRGLVINRFSGSGIGLVNGGENTIEGNFIGTDVTGTMALGNGDGIWFGEGTSNNMIGGVTPATRNLISGNKIIGVSINYGASENQIVGNFIGTDTTGTNPLGNSIGGVSLGSGSINNMIGGSQAGAGNIISGNQGNGVNISDPGTTGNIVQGNNFGTDVTGTTATGSTSGPSVGNYTLTAMPETCPTYPAGTERGGFVSESDDPLAPWSGTSVTFKGTDEDKCDIPDTFEDVPLIYRYKLKFDDPDTELTSIAVSGAAFNGSILRVLDENMNELGIAYNYGGNSFQTSYVTLSGVVGQIFFVEEYDSSSDWRFRQSIVINGPAPLGNHGSGVLIAGGAPNNTVIKNLISGNMGNGVAIFNPGTTGNVVQENKIGTDITGTQALGNAAPGIGIGDQAYENFIIGNLISGNASDGVAIFNAGTNGNMLQGNNIGTDIDREAAVPNLGVGVWIGDSASNTIIGGNDASVRNVISGNRWGGVSINDLGTIGTRVTGNYIGTNKDGDVALPNGGDGVYISGSESVIGGSEPGAGNLISGNIASGVSMAWGATGNLIQSNFIGTNVSGTAPLYSASGPDFGHYELDALDETCPTYEAGTSRDPFVSESSDPLAPWDGTSVMFMGTDEDKCGVPDIFEGAPLIYRYKLTFDEPTVLTSIAVTGAAFGGGALRVLDENREVLGTSYNFGGNSYQTNYVRLSGVVGQVFFIEEYDYSSDWRYRESIVINGPLPVGNLGSGVNFNNGASNNLVLDNLISGNRSDAVSLYHTGTNGNVLQGNYIGTNVSGTVAVPNTSAAIWIGEGASNTVIGGIEEGQGNLVSGNTGDAISINHAETMGTVIQGNYIGTDVTGAMALPNNSNAIVLVSGTHDNLIGGTEPGAGNILAYNYGTGILYGDAGVGNAALSNSVFTNGWLGIDLGSDYVTRNDPLDQDTGPNNLQNFPIITVVTRLASEVMIKGLLPSTPQTTFRVEFFSNETCDPSGFGEGGTFLGATTIKTNQAGLAHFAITLPISLPQGAFVTATATDPSGNTSEFSKCFSPAPGWNHVNDSGFGDPENISITALDVFQNQLYAGATNWDEGGQVWRLGRDGLWSQVSTAGFGDGPTSPAIVDLIVFQGQLYAGTGWDNASGQMWRSADGTNWQPVTTDGFGNPENIAVTNFVVFKNMLYAGTGTTSTSAQIWRSNTGTSGSWQQVAPDAGGFAGNVTGFAAYKNLLYAAIEPPGGVGAPAQVWRSTNGSDWVTVTSDGFGNVLNESTGGFAEFGGYLYLGTQNQDTGAQLWRTSDGMNWQPVIENGFGDSSNIKIESLRVYDGFLYAATKNLVTGMQVWRSTNGMNWEQVIVNGFGDSSNFSTLWNSATTTYQGQLLIGTWNYAEGGEIWRFTP